MVKGVQLPRQYSITEDEWMSIASINGWNDATETDMVEGRTLHK